MKRPVAKILLVGAITTLSACVVGNWAIAQERQIILDDATQPNPGALGPNYSGSGSGSSQPPNLTDDPTQIIEQVETYQSQSYADYLGVTLYGELTSTDQISQTLKALGKKTGTNPALVYVLSTRKGLKLVLVLPDAPTEPSSTSTWRLPLTPFRLASTQGRSLFAQQSNPTTPSNPTPAAPRTLSFLVPNTSTSALKRVTRTFRSEVSAPDKVGTTSYQTAAKQLYDWVIRPIKPTLDANKIDTLVFSMDRGFRSMPVAALYDGQQFLVEQYNLALIPSFSLTDTRFQSIQSSKLLGMGIAQPVAGLDPLPAVSIELPTVTSQLWQGQSYLDQSATLDQFQTLAQREQFSIIHLATHAQFNPGKINQSFIQFWDGRLTMPKLRTIALKQKWSATPTIEMLVLSACQTALGNDQAELGFTGLAVQTGVKTAIGSLWSVSDAGTLGLMSEFYRNLKTAPIRSAALRTAQLGLLKGQVKVVEGKLQLADGTQVALPTAIASQTKDLSHPYFWSAYTLIGNWN